jgi:hypothetical protein
MCSLPTSRLLLLSNSRKTGQTVGRPQKPLRKLPSAAKHSVTLASGTLRTLLFLSSRERKVLLPKARPPTTPFLLPLRSPLILRTSPWSFNTKSNTRKVVTAVVVTSSFWRTASRPAERSSQTPLLGWLCSVLI